MDRRSAGTAMRGAQFVDPSALARMGNLELVARTVVDGFINGLHRAPHMGFSLDFAEHRGYEPGDDLRRVDWRVFARTDRYYVKQFEADTNANCVVALDVSKSMRFGTGPISKLDYGAFWPPRSCISPTSSAIVWGSSPSTIGCWSTCRPPARHLEFALYALDRVGEARPGSLAAPMLTLTERLARRGIVIVISDFYDEPDRVAQAVRR